MMDDKMCRFYWSIHLLYQFGHARAHILFEITVFIPCKECCLYFLISQLTFFVQWYMLMSSYLNYMYLSHLILSFHRININNGLYFFIIWRNIYKKHLKYSHEWNAHYPMYGKGLQNSDIISTISGLLFVHCIHCQNVFSILTALVLNLLTHMYINHPSICWFQQWHQGTECYS